MLFPRIDVRMGLLSNHGERLARYAEEVEIDVESTCRSKDAIVLLKSAKRSLESYMVDAARAKLASASQLARRDKDGFVEAAALLLLTTMMDGQSHHSSQTHFSDEAVQALEFEIYTLGEQFIEAAAGRSVTDPVMLPRVALLDLLKHNKAQYQLRQDCLMLAETKTRADQLLAANNITAAYNVAKTGVDNALGQFGDRHWWPAVMRTRVATALARQGKLQEPRKTAVQIQSMLLEWTLEPLNESVFKKELAMLQELASIGEKAHG